MVEPIEPGLTVAEAALLLGISHDAVHKRIKRSQLRAWKEGGEWRVVVPPKVIHAATRDETSLPEEPALPAVMSRDPTGQLAALSDYNRRLVEPWSAQVTELRTQLAAAKELIAQHREENRDLKRQVKHLKTVLEGVQVALARALGKTEE